MDALREVRKFVPPGFNLLARDNVIVVLHGRLAVTVINSELDIEEQVRADTCDAHRAFCCEACFDMTS